MLARSGTMRGRVSRAAAGVLVLTLLAGCATDDLAPDVEASVSARPSPTATTTPTPDPTFVPGGTAGQNRPLFEFVLTGVLESSSTPSSLTLVDALTAAGFDRASLEVTPDTTPTGRPADSILIAAQIDGQCLLGQIIGGELRTQLSDVLGTGRCLVGRTLSLD